MEDASLDKCANCANCHRTALNNDKPLKPCAKCNGGAYYCSRKCQTLYWKHHKKECAKSRSSTFITRSNPSSPSAPPTFLKPRIPFLEQSHPYPFQALARRQWLSHRPQHDVYKLLHDSFRLRLEDNFTINDEIEIGSIYHNDNEDSLEAFKHGFLQMASEKGLMPAWLDDNWAVDCLMNGRRTGRDDAEWGGLTTRLTAADIVEQYTDDSMPLQMRMFAQQVYGDDPSGQVENMKSQPQYITRSEAAGSN